MRALSDSHVILGGQPTVRPVVAIESVFQVNVGLPDEVVRTHEVMIEHSHSQLWLSRERDAELQDPGQEGEWLRTPPCPRKLSYVGRSFRGLRSFCPFSHHQYISCLSMSQTTYVKVTPQNLGPSLTLQRWGSVAWGCSAPWCPAAPGQRSPPHRGLLCHWGPQEPGW